MSLIIVSNWFVKVTLQPKRTVRETIFKLPSNKYFKQLKNIHFLQSAAKGADIMVPWVSPTCVSKPQSRGYSYPPTQWSSRDTWNAANRWGITMRKCEEFSSHPLVVAKTFPAKQTTIFYFWLEINWHDLNLDPADLWTSLDSNWVRSRLSHDLVFHA